MFWEIYTQLCQSRGLSPNAVAKELSIASGTVTEWKRGRTPQNMTLKRIGAYFGVSVECLLGREAVSGYVPSAEARRALRIPVFRELVKGVPVESVSVGADVDFSDDISTVGRFVRPFSVAAGIPISKIDEYDDYEEIPTETAGKGEYIALRIRDDSMEPRMQEGDVVIVRCQQEMLDGETVIVFVPEEEHALCRRVKRTAEGVLLLAANAKYEPIFCTEQQLADGDVRLFGRVVELRAKF